MVAERLVLVERKPDVADGFVVEWLSDKRRRLITQRFSISTRYIKNEDLAGLAPSISPKTLPFAEPAQA